MKKSTYAALQGNTYIIWYGFFVFLIASAFIFRTWIGLAIWKVSHLPEVALFFDRDATFALEIGNYYFNVYGDGVYNLQKAHAYFNLSLARDPNVPDAWHQLARIDFLNRDFAGALEKINTQITLHGNSLMASYYIRGLINGFLGNANDAERDFLTFLSWDTKNWAAHNDLAWVYFSQGEYRKTEEIARAGLVFNPENPWLLTSLGVALLNQGKKTEAHMVFTSALKQAEKLTTADWHHAYPGNDPLLGDTGLKKMQEVIRRNLVLAS